MNFLARIVANKLFALTVIVAIGGWFLVLPAFTDGLSANLVEKLLHRTGEIAIWMLGGVLALTPLRTLFPRDPITAGLNRHRRNIGVGACIYGLLHLTCHLFYQDDVDEILRSFTRPFVWFGAAGLSVLIVLMFTSNHVAMRALGSRNWKRLHRLAYLAAALLFYHQAIAGKGHWYVAKYLFLPLVALEIARAIKIGLDRRHAPATPVAAT